MSINYLEKITEIYAFVSVDEGGEGVVGMTMPVGGRETFMPFVCADKKRMESLKPMAIEIAKKSGKTIRLVKFDNRKVIEVIEFPQEKSDPCKHEAWKTVHLDEIGVLDVCNQCKKARQPGESWK